MQRHSLQKLCLCIFRQQHPVINIIITGDLPAVMTVVFYNRWQIIVAGSQAVIRL